MSGDYHVYTGHIWTDHTDGRLILTLKEAAAGALQSAIPIWVSLVGAASWILVSRTWYHLRFRYGRGKNEHDLFERQEQILLHNSGGDLGTLRDVYDLLKAWRHKRHSRSPFLLFFTLGTLVFWTCWQVSAIVVFYIWQTKVPDHGLIRSSKCGYLVLNSSTREFNFRSIGLSQTILAETWVSQCYTNSSTDSGACNLYPKTELGFSSTTEVECPFASSDLCISTNSTPYQLTSGPINSHFDLGINAPPDERIVYYKNTTCSPIHGTPFAEIVNANETDEADIWPADTVLQRFYLGPVDGTNVTWTFEYNTWAPEDGIGYRITSVGYTPGPDLPGYTNAWAPNRTFFDRDDADLSLFFLTQNHMGYSSPSYDPFYLATTPYTQYLPDEVVTYWLPTYYVNLLSCVDQHRICDPTKDEASGCTAPMAWLQLSEAIFDMGLKPSQIAAAERVVANLVMTNTLNSVNGRNAAALLASQNVSELLQIENLPINQWQLEVQNWFLVSLAKLQRSVIDYAGGPSDNSLNSYAHPQPWPPLAKMCDTQFVKLPASGYVNFNFDAIIGVFVAGVVLGLLNFFFEDIFDYWLKRNNGDGRLQWIYDGSYQLQRMTYVGKGVKDWDDEEEDLPTTSSSLPALINRPQQTSANPATILVSTSSGGGPSSQRPSAASGATQQSGLSQSGVTPATPTSPITSSNPPPTISTSTNTNSAPAPGSQPTSSGALKLPAK